jgi:hypothetical protein
LGLGWFGLFWFVGVGLGWVGLVVCLALLFRWLVVFDERGHPF